MSRHSAQGGTSVLIVDDDAVCRYFCEQALATGDRRIFLAESAETAMHFVRTWRPAVIVLDLHLKSERGQALQAVVLNDWPNDTVLPVFIAMTGDDIRTRGARQQLAGFSKVLRKPFSVDLLRDLVSQALMQTPGLPTRSETRPVSATANLEQVLRAEWSAGVDELDLHIAALDWDEAIVTLHRLGGAAALAGRQELAQGARRLMREITSAPHGAEMMAVYADFLWQGVEFTRELKKGPSLSSVTNEQAHFPDSVLETNENRASND